MLLVAVDTRRDPAVQLSTRVAMTGIALYQATLSRWYARMGLQCRFTPTCSHYSEACLRHYGAVRGGWMAMKRIVRCGPWTAMGTVDLPPVPPA